jgi:hypothetical protein
VGTQTGTKHKPNAERISETNNKQTNELTASSTVLLEKPTAPQPVGKYGTENFIAVCPTAQHNSSCEQSAEWGCNKTVKERKVSGGR